jgi:hypothetical protein
VERLSDECEDDHEHEWAWMSMNEHEWAWMSMNEHEWAWMSMNEHVDELDAHRPLTA